MSEITQKPNLSERLKQILFRKTTEYLLNEKLRPAGPEAAESSSSEQPAGFTAEIEQTHPGAPQLTITGETRAKLDEKIEKAGLGKRTMTITKNPSDK